MVTRHGAKRFITAVLPEIKNRLDAGYTIKEIHADLPDLANNISYSATLRNLQKMGISERTSHQGKTPKTESQKNEGPSELQKEQPHAERNLEKLKNKKPGCVYDPHTNGKDFI